MTACNHSRWEPSHDYRPLETTAERQAWRVAALTGATMLVEIVAGYAFNSMALLADGWHMASHMLAIGLTALAYLLARRYANDPRFAFGTWKVEVAGRVRQLTDVTGGGGDAGVRILLAFVAAPGDCLRDGAVGRRHWLVGQPGFCLAAA